MNKVAPSAWLADAFGVGWLAHGWYASSGMVITWDKVIWLTVFGVVVKPSSNETWSFGGFQAPDGYPPLHPFPWDSAAC